MTRKRKPKSDRVVKPDAAPPEPPPTASDRGLRCPRCGCAHLIVLYTRQTGGNRVRRRRECRHCGKRITTHESGPEPSP